MTTFNKDELAMLHKLFIEIYKNGFNNSPEEAKKALSLLDTEYDDLGVKPSHIHASGEKQKKAMKLLLEHIVEVLEDEDVDFNLEINRAMIEHSTGKDQSSDLPDEPPEKVR